MHDSQIEVTEVTTEPVKLRDQFAKMILVTAASFVAGKLTENAYDKFVVARRIKS